MANADIIIADERLLPQAVELYNQMFRPKRETDFFKRRNWQRGLGGGQTKRALGQISSWPQKRRFLA